MHSDRFKSALAAFDALNSEDPNQVTCAKGSLQPRELQDALAMTRWIETLYPDASEAVRLAARCQHLCRWEIPRKSYPEGRTAYLKWRSDLKRFHADRSEQVLRSVGYEEPMLTQVREINLKKGLAHNADVQAIEDALCLVFLETQLEHYLDKWEDTDKVVSILKKTWGKMSPLARTAALSLSFSERARKLIVRATSESAT